MPPPSKRAPSIPSTPPKHTNPPPHPTKPTIKGPPVHSNGGHSRSRQTHFHRYCAYKRSIFVLMPRVPRRVDPCARCTRERRVFGVRYARQGTSSATHTTARVTQSGTSSAPDSNATSRRAQRLVALRAARSWLPHSPKRPLTADALVAGTDARAREVAIRIGLMGTAHGLRV